MVCVLFPDKNFENFILSALELLGYEYQSGLSPYSGAVICSESELDGAISYYSAEEEKPVYVVISKKRAAQRLCDSADNEVRFLHYPFSISALASLINGARNTTESVSCGEVEYFSEKGAVSFNGKKVQLTEREGMLFSYLFSRRGEIVSREEISASVWGRSDSFTNVTDVYISYLRKKLAPLLGQGVIRSVHGVGYILDI